MLQGKRKSMDIKGIFLIAAGIFSICGALFDWEWFMNHRKAQFFNRIWGRQGTRIFYGALGVAISAIGIAATTGALK